MTESEFQIACLNDPRLAAHALSPMPAWLWSADASRILWANPTAAAVFEAATPGALGPRRFDAGHPAAAQIARLAASLPAAGTARLERLRGFGASVGGMLICQCSRLTLARNGAAILIVSTERAGPDLSLPERARRLLADMQRPAAVFSADGELIEATSAARERFGKSRDLIALGAGKLAKEASLNGEAEGDIGIGRVMLRRLGAGATVTLLLALAGAAIKPTTADGDLRPAQPPAILPPLPVALPAAPAMAPPAAPTMAPAAAVAPTVPNPVAMDGATRRFPLRFVWQMDAATHFTLDSEPFSRLVGPQTAGLFGRPWAEIAARLKLDPTGEVARALAARNTWSGLIVLWPLADGGDRLPVEMSGLPVFDRERNFAGFRGFGVCRDVERFTAPLRQAPSAEGEAQAANVLPFRAAPKPPEPAPVLSPVEHNAFQELARELSDRLKKTAGRDVPAQMDDDFGSEPAVAPEPEPVKAALPRTEPAKPAGNGNAARDTQEARPILDRMPVGVLVYRLSNLLYANRAFLDWTGYASLDALNEAGGLDSLFIESKPEPAANEAGTKNATKNGGKTLTIATANGQQMPVEGRLFSVAWNGEPALVLMLNTVPAIAAAGSKDTEAALRRAEDENNELKAVLDTATDGVLVLDRTGRVLSANRSAEALFGYAAKDFATLTFGELFAPESRRPALDYLDRLARDTAPVLINEGKELIGRVRQGGLVPLYITLGRIEDGDKLCAVLRDVTAWKRTEEELINARQQAEKASTAKSEFLAKISHEIRTPLNAIIGFSEVMIDERFGPVGNERYRQYLKDIHSSGGHLISLLNDLLDLSKIEAGKLDLTFVSVSLNDLVQQCVAIMQQQANRERVIIRSSLAQNLPRIVADARSVRQIALNLLSNSIKFTGAGGQVIVSTALTDEAEVALRVRDTGVGMSETELQTAMEPFRQLAVSTRWGSSGTGLGLPITKALSEANHARFRITSAVDTGTLVEVAFPATRVLAH
jgi:PAS domain S-box-containing protein